MYNRAAFSKELNIKPYFRGLGTVQFRVLSLVLHVSSVVLLSSIALLV